MHFVIILVIVCLYSLKSIIMLTVIMHSFPFHCHFRTNSIQFSDDLGNNKTIPRSKFLIHDHTDSNHTMT